MNCRLLAFSIFRQFVANSIMDFRVAFSSSLGGHFTPCTIRPHLRLWSSISMVRRVSVVATFSMCVFSDGIVVWISS